MERMPGGDDPNKSELEKTIDILKELRDGFDTDIPEEILHSTDKNNKIKARKAWFTTVIGRLTFFQEDYLDIKADKELWDDIENFVREYSGKNFQLKIRTEEADISRADELLDRAIEYLESL